MGGAERAMVEVVVVSRVCAREVVVVVTLPHHSDSRLRDGGGRAWAAGHVRVVALHWRAEGWGGRA